MKHCHVDPQRAAFMVNPNQITGADIEGAQETDALPFLRQFFLKVTKIGLVFQKNLGSDPPNHLRPLLFQILDPLRLH